MAGSIVQPRTSLGSGRAVGGPNRPRTQSSTPPPRPAVTADLLPPSARERAGAPRALRISAGLWFASCAAGMVGVAATLLDGAALADRLTATAHAQDPGASAGVVDQGVQTTIALVTGIPSVVVLLTFTGIALVLRGRAAGRWVLLLTAPLGILVAGAAQSVVSGGADVDRIGLVAQGALLLLGLLLLVVRPMRSAATSSRS